MKVNFGLQYENTQEPHAHPCTVIICLTGHVYCSYFLEKDATVCISCMINGFEAQVKQLVLTHKFVNNFYTHSL